MGKLVEIISSLDRRRSAILAVVAGSGQVTRCAVDAGADLLMVLSAGAFRTLGAGSLASFLPYGNANDLTESLLREHVLPRSAGVPVVAGVFAADPTQAVENRLRRLKSLGVEGVVNWPAVGFVDGRYRQALEAEGLGMRQEAEMLARAKSLGLTTFGFALSEEEVACYLDAGVDALVLNLGLTRRVDDVQEKRDQLHRAIARLNAMLELVRRRNKNCLCLGFGGPITSPEDLEEVFRHSTVHGFAGGSVFERLPVQSVVTSTVRRFKSVALSRARKSEDGFGPMIGHSAPFREVVGLIKRVAPYDVNVYIEGETGTGKELVAMQIHRLSLRASQPFITLNCGAIPESLLESELFGHEKGAFTNADRRRLGKFELAHGGTLFLDEIADLSPRGQVALLRAIQQREISRVGGETMLPVDVRIIAASNRPLAQAVAESRFRQDLYYRLNWITIGVPPLRERLDDIPSLVESIVARLQVQLGRKLLGTSTSFLNKLNSHAWPGNVRELEHVIGQAALREDGPVLEGRYFTPHAATEFRSAALIAVRPDDGPRSRKSLAREALTAARGNKSQAAAAFGIARRTFYAWLRERE